MVEASECSRQLDTEQCQLDLVINKNGAAAPFLFYPDMLLSVSDRLFFSVPTEPAESHWKPRRQRRQVSCNQA